MKLSIASLSGADFALRPAPAPLARPASSSLLDDEEDIPTTLLRPRRGGAAAPPLPTKARGRAKGALAPSL